MEYVCALCDRPGKAIISWPGSNGQQKHVVCVPCGTKIWDQIKRDFSGTAACDGLCVEHLPVDRGL